ncbi:hypothetical protein, partial [Bradyrhizobium brasilense]|uniref:hypothetical protein n=1 Tax=Bradyrhizobium brasilense TaxID=1419277 RepID=UPI001E5E9EEF
MTGSSPERPESVDRPQDELPGCKHDNQPGRNRIAVIEDVTLGAAPPETLVFHLNTAGGYHLELDFETMLRALMFAQHKGIIPALPAAWLDQARMLYRYAVGDEAAESSATETDLTGLIECRDGDTDLLVSPGTLLQCLQIGVTEGRLPPLDQDW